MADETPFTSGTSSGPPLRRSDLAALVQLLRGGQQSRSPYELQTEAPVIVGQEQDPEQQFHADWDTAMQQYEQALTNPNVSSSSARRALSAAGLPTQSADALATPQELFQNIVSPLRYRAAEFSPEISRTFLENDLEQQRAAQRAHWQALAKMAQDREKRYAADAAAKANKPPKAFPVPTQPEIDILNKYKDAWPEFEAKHGPGSAAKYMMVETPFTTGKGRGAQQGFPTNVTAGQSQDRPAVLPPWATAGALGMTAPVATIAPSTPTPQTLGPRTPVRFGRGSASASAAPSDVAPNFVKMVDPDGTEWNIPVDRVPEAERRGARRK